MPRQNNPRTSRASMPDGFGPAEGGLHLGGTDTRVVRRFRRRLTFDATPPFEESMPQRAQVPFVALLAVIALAACGGNEEVHDPFMGGNNGADAGEDSQVDGDVTQDADVPEPDAPDVVEDAPEEDVPDVDRPAEDAGSEDAGTDVNFEPGGECDPYLQDCPEDEDGDAQQCNPIQGEPMCIQQNPQQLGEDETCQGGDCAPGMTCINWSDGRGLVCTRMCNRNDGSGCGEDKECGAWLRSNSNIGLCRPPRADCDIYAQDCADGEACTFGLDPETNEPIFVCETAGDNADGDPCSNGNGRCMAGLVCIRDDDTNSSCHSICRTDEECTAEGQMCTGRSATWQVTFCR